MLISEEKVSTADGGPVGRRRRRWSEAQKRRIVAETQEPGVSKVFADGGYGGPKLRDALARRGLSELVEIVEKPRQVKAFTVLHRRWVVERTFARMGRCRRLAKDFERNEASSLAWATLAVCRFLMRRIAQETNA